MSVQVSAGFAILHPSIGVAQVFVALNGQAREGWLEIAISGRGTRHERVWGTTLAHVGQGTSPQISPT